MNKEFMDMNLSELKETIESQKREIKNWELVFSKQEKELEEAKKDQASLAISLKNEVDKKLAFEKDLIEAKKGGVKWHKNDTQMTIVQSTKDHVLVSWENWSCKLPKPIHRTIEDDAEEAWQNSNYFPLNHANGWKAGFKAAKESQNG